MDWFRRVTGGSTRLSELVCRLGLGWVGRCQVRGNFIDRRSTIIFVWWVVCDDIKLHSGACVSQTECPVTWFVNVGRIFVGVWITSVVYYTNEDRVYRNGRQ